MERLEINRIIDQIERLYGKNWPEVNLQEILDEIAEPVANSKLPGFNNSIHQIARHIIADVLLVTKRLQGINYELTPEENWIPDDKIASLDWLETKKALKESKTALINQLQSLKDADLDNPILKDYSTIYVTLHGHIQHSYYHIGQISVIYRVVSYLRA